MKALRALVAVAFLAMGSTAIASDDCCWDWSDDPGAFDLLPGGGGLGDGPPRAGLPNGWSRCEVATPGGQAACFQRQGRQIRRPQWFCVLNSPDPNGQLPPPGQGFRCDPKAGAGVWWVSRYPRSITQPPGGFQLLSLEGPDQGQVPTMTEWAIVALIAILGIGGIWMVRRRTPSVTAA